MENPILKFLFSLWVILFLSVSVQAQAAASACYTPEQLRAEQALRLHSELMVITVTCRHGSEGQDLTTAYGDFTKKNIGFLHNAEQTLIAYYQTHAKGKALDNLDRLRTKLGNEFGQKAADMSSPAFCATYRDKVVDYSMAPPLSVEDEVRRMEVSVHSYVKSCDVSRTVTARKGD